MVEGEQREGLVPEINAEMREKIEGIYKQLLRIEEETRDIVAKMRKLEPIVDECLEVLKSENMIMYLEYIGLREQLDYLNQHSKELFKMRAVLEGFEKNTQKVTDKLEEYGEDFELKFDE